MVVQDRYAVCGFDFPPAPSEDGIDLAIASILRGRERGIEEADFGRFSWHDPQESKFRLSIAWLLRARSGWRFRKSQR